MSKFRPSIEYIYYHDSLNSDELFSQDTFEL